MTTMTEERLPVTGGVDTHRDVHVAAVLDVRSAELGVAEFSANTAGYRQLLAWVTSFGPIEAIGVEGTGSYSKGLTRHLLAEGIPVVEVDRPNRQDRRLSGKSDTIDAIAGKQIRHRLSRSGNRQANTTLYRIAIGRMKTDPTTQAYTARRRSEGKTKLEAIRCP